MRKVEIVVNEGYKDLNPVSFGYEVCEKSHSYGPAVRSHWLLHYVVSGKGIFERDSKRYRLSQGDIFVIPPYLQTYYEADSQTPWEYIWIGFNSSLPLPGALQNPVIHCPEAAGIFGQMKLCQSLDSGKSAYLAGCLWQLISIFTELDRVKGDYVDKALSFIHTQYGTSIRVSDLAEQLNLDRCYFSDLFKKRTGQSPGTYLRYYRLAKAAELMRAYGESPATAAYSVGFEDLAHFSKSFKKQFGVSPRAYAEKNKA